MLVLGGPAQEALAIKRSGRAPQEVVVISSPTRPSQLEPPMNERKVYRMPHLSSRQSFAGQPACAGRRRGYYVSAGVTTTMLRVRWTCDRIAPASIRHYHEHA